MAPYAIAHLKIGLKLYETGYRFGSDERARVYLTNALEPAQDFSGRFEFAIPALAREADSVNEVKRCGRFTVVIGNPPYSLLSGNLSSEQRSLVEPYKYIGSEKISERGALQFEKNIQDDYVKFIRLAELAVKASTVGAVGLITNHAFIDNTTFRGLRWHLLNTYERLRIVNLHGNAKRGLTGADQNVFDIQQGVAMALYTRVPSANSKALGSVSYQEVVGTRDEKYRWLMASFPDRAASTSVAAAPPGFLFLPLGVQFPEYDAAPSLSEIFRQYSAGIITARDGLVVDIDRAAVRDRIAAFASSGLADKELLGQFSVSDKKGWDVAKARRSLRALRSIDDCIAEVTYRPLDKRWLFYHSSLVWGMAAPTFSHVFRRQNLVLMTTRKVEVGKFNHAMVVNGLAECHSVSMKEVNYAFPQLVYGDEGGLGFKRGGAANFSDSFARMLRQRFHLSDEQLAGQGFGYIYGLLHSVGFRTRYAEFLRIEFPRVPIPAQSECFSALAELGRALIAVHLLESPELTQPISEYLGGRAPEVEKVSRSNNTVWLDKAQTTGFKGVREEVWNFHIGGYQVCEKWLKDRKGRTLSKADIAHYQKIVVALSETIRLMKEIDQVIEQHGGWPGAFQTGEAKAATAKVIPFRPRTVEPKLEERYVTCVPLVPLKAAAGAFSDPQHIEDDGFEWVAVEPRHRLRKGMFVAQVVGKSMEPAIPDGAFCLFRAPVEGTRQGKTVLVQLRDATDPETGQRFTVKRYESEKVERGDSWRHERITLIPVNSEFEPIPLKGKDEGELQVIAELIEVLGGES
ncbi:MAG: hypothetical protein FJ167_01315 [Gammaproteobacteria bacterium]|nr:hypothetical protein [Gammaproteobacteria bacterium]